MDVDGPPCAPDKKTHKVVSNESSEIIRDLNACFNDFAKNPDLDLYPEAGCGCESSRSAARSNPPLS